MFLNATINKNVLLYEELRVLSIRVFIMVRSGRAHKGVHCAQRSYLNVRELFYVYHRGLNFLFFIPAQLDHLDIMSLLWNRVHPGVSQFGPPA